MCYGGIVDAYATILCPASELHGRKWGAQIHNYSVRHTKAVHDLLNKLDGLGCAVLDEWFIFNLLGELVDGHIDVLKTTLSSLERSHLIQSLARKRPS
jgi:hypothetical protein